MKTQGVIQNWRPRMEIQGGSSRKSMVKDGDPNWRPKHVFVILPRLDLWSSYWLMKINLNMGHAMSYLSYFISIHVMPCIRCNMVITKKDKNWAKPSYNIKSLKCLPTVQYLWRFGLLYLGYAKALCIK